jgi:CxxC motif-containing protein (DUF1111 family)
MSKMYLRSFCGVAVIMCLLYSCTKEPSTSGNSWYEEGEEMAGGINTIEVPMGEDFDAPSPALSQSELQQHRLGLALFRDDFVASDSFAQGGLGPIFNNSSCENCHKLNGAAPFPTIQNRLTGLLLRLSSGSGSYGRPLPVPGFGGQLQQRAIPGSAPEAVVNWIFEEHTETFADGEVVSLRKPVFSILNTYTSFPSDAMVSPRIAGHMFGLGLLEAIDDNTLLAMADEYDSNKDGISGRPNYVWDDQNKHLVMGRFGWKANQPHLYQQCAAAYQEDMGVTSVLYTNESCKDQSQYDNGKNDVRLSFSQVTQTAFYLKSTGAPKRRNADDETVLKGKQIFYEAKCNSCHTPKMQTGSSMDAPFNSNQTIYPYTDLLLHDMGDGLSDNRGDFAATGTEWRTPPLWGMGLIPLLNGHSDMLHDGRARNFMEAVLWHGGEAQASKDYVKKLSKADREALVKFMESL